jgi:hypothetical protein
MIDYKSSILNMTSNNKYFIQDWDTINKYFIQDCSFKLLLFHVRLRHTINKYFIQDWDTQLINILYKIETQLLLVTFKIELVLSVILFQYTSILLKCQRDVFNLYKSFII